MAFHPPSKIGAYTNNFTTKYSFNPSKTHWRRALISEAHYAGELTNGAMPVGYYAIGSRWLS
jgi:hypothetical protein